MDTFCGLFNVNLYQSVSRVLLPLAHEPT